VRQDPGLLPLQIYLGGRPFSLPLSEMFVKAPARNGGELCLLTIQPNANAPSSSAGVGSTLGDLLGAIFGGGNVRVARAVPQASQGGGPEGMPLPPMPFGMPQGSNEVLEETTEYVRSDGRMCKVTRLIRDGHVVQQSAPRCEQPQPQRRLQSAPWPWETSQQPQEPQGPQEDDELWMLGGVFLEHFVTAFDFDHGRLGMGEPAGSETSRPLWT